MDYESAVKRQRKYFLSGETLAYEFRMESLRRLKKAIRKYENDILCGMETDLAKPHFEGYEAEVGIVYEEINYAMKHLKKWMRPEKVKTPLIDFPAKSRVVKQPLGVALIMSPWNYPFQLTIAPLAAAIAAGDCCVVKPSRYSPATSAVIERMLKETFSEEYITVFQGGSEVNTRLLDLKFDCIFFTGSPTVGKVVMEKAAKFLCPVTLELGGKSPCIVDETADIKLAARRIMWGKCINSGQTCVAPDYLIAHKSVKQALLKELENAVKSFYGANALESPDYCKIISRKHYDRLKSALKDGEIVFGGECDDRTMKIQPTVMCDLPSDSPLLTEEIFGPILPVLEFETLDEVIVYIEDRPKPLALYYFTDRKSRMRRIIERTSFGGGVMNDTVVHLTNPNMHFGGVGESGMGGYHGRRGFETFSHRKSVMYRGKFDIQVRYAPYEGKMKTIRKLMK